MLLRLAQQLLQQVFQLARQLVHLEHQLLRLLIQIQIVHHLPELLQDLGLPPKVIRNHQAYLRPLVKVELFQ